MNNELKAYIQEHCELINGTLTWTKVPKYYSKKVLGKQVGSYDTDGYLRVQYKGKSHKVHRIIWWLEYGVIPNQIDHINGKLDDNRLCNLRNVDAQGNQRNRSLGSNNKTGVIGVVYRHKSTSPNRWLAYIIVDYKQIHLGIFSTKEEAIKVRKLAEKGYGFHENHSRTRY